MNIYKYIPAVMLIIAGAAKMVAQATMQETFLIPMCVGQSIEVAAGPAAFNVLHCWGCYAVLAGLTFTAALAINRRKSALHAPIKSL